MDDHQFRWEEPATPRQRYLAEYAPDLEKVHKRPGEWARLRVYKTHSGAYSAARMLRGRVTDPRWEFKSAMLREGKQHGVYARYRRADQMPTKKPPTPKE